MCDGISVKSPHVYMNIYKIHKMIAASGHIIMIIIKQRLGDLHMSDKGRKRANVLC